VLDFNLAADVKGGGLSSVRIGGTVPYMSPEQLRCFADQPDKMDHRSDIYSLGIILWELLSGKHPFRIHGGNSDASIEQMLEVRKKWSATLCDKNTTVTPAVESIVQRCVAFDPKDRYQSAEHLVEDIERHLENLPLKYAKETSFNERVAKWSRRHP